MAEIDDELKRLDNNRDRTRVALLWCGLIGVAANVLSLIFDQSATLGDRGLSLAVAITALFYGLTGLASKYK